jgi:UDP-N-acetylglucosamine--N-acetylmuramyl-(pentapeptide) pyrophosphoryl-undecaprenol N-acetylglucosamine transferase
LIPGLTLGHHLQTHFQARVLYLINDKPIARQFEGRFTSPPFLLPEIAWRDWRRGLHTFKQVRHQWSAIHEKLVCDCPVLLIAAGGGSGFLPALWCHLRKVPIVLLEQNRVMGRANRLLFRFARQAYLTFPLVKASDPSKAHVTGNPVRGIDEVKCNNRKQAAHHLGLKEDALTFLIIGGSQGARRLNEFAMQLIPKWLALRPDLQVIHLTGSGMLEECRALYKRLKISYFCEPFSEAMDSIYSLSDIALSRAGGGVLAELMLYGIPACLVPYPFATENHQWANASYVADQGAGWLMTDEQLGQANAVEQFLQQVSNESRLQQFHLASIASGQPEAAATIGQHLTTLLDLKERK